MSATSRALKSGRQPEEHHQEHHQKDKPMTQPKTQTPRLRDDGSMMTPGEAMAETAEEQAKELSELGFPLWLHSKASSRPSS